MIEFDFGAPATVTHGEKAPFSHFVTFLQANPGQWAEYHTYDHKSTANRRALRARGQYPKEQFEFTIRRVTNGYTVYGKYRPHGVAQVPAA